ncbi:MAG: hypothetical protein IJH65_03165 [Methanobrevibacter sp.]|nr:hypothetical protein [Methanobrevibacter sp.]
MANRKFDIQLKDKSRNLLYPLAHKDSSGNIIPTTYVKKSGDKMSGDLGLIGVSSLENYSGSSQKENYSRREVYAEISVSEVQAIDSTLTTNSSISDYMAGILKALCVKYPNRVNTIFKGHTAKGSHFYYEVFIYNTNNKVNDLPQYSFGSLRNYNTRGNVTTFYLIGTGISSNNHSYYCVNVTAHSVQNKIYYGTCSTAADTAEKAVDCNNFVLATGATVLVTFSNTNSVAVASLTLNVDGTGAAPIKCFRNGGINNLPGVGYLASNQTYLFSYDGTN